MVQFAKGDETVPNPLATALLRAGDLEDRATYFRNDLAFADNPAEALVDPHGFLSSFDNSFTTEISDVVKGRSRPSSNRTATISSTPIRLTSKCRSQRRSLRISTSCPSQFSRLQLVARRNYSSGARPCRHPWLTVDFRLVTSDFTFVPLEVTPAGKWDARGSQAAARQAL